MATAMTGTSLVLYIGNLLDSHQSMDSCKPFPERRIWQKASQDMTVGSEVQA